MQTFEIIAAFQQAMRDHGIEPPDHINADGHLHRFHIPGQRNGTKNGAYSLHLTGPRPAGYFEDFKTGIKTTWKADGPAKPVSNEERQRIERKKRKFEDDINVKHERTAGDAKRLWSSAKRAGPEHPYLIKKNVMPHQLRMLNVWQKRYKDDAGNWQTLIVKNALLVPLTDIRGKLWNLQAIFSEKLPELGRDKDFLAGGRLGGLSCVIGKPTPEQIVCEGFATGATLHEATGFQTFSAMSANNLSAVAKAIRQHRPGAKIIIAADNDAKTPGNPGVKYATQAAQAVGGLLCIAPAGDFNDLASSTAREIK